MQKLFSSLLCLLLVCACGSCGNHRAKSSAHIYEGDAPTIRFHNRPETVGGRVNTY